MSWSLAPSLGGGPGGPTAPASRRPASNITPENTHRVNMGTLIYHSIVSQIHCNDSFCTLLVLMVEICEFRVYRIVYREKYGLLSQTCIFPDMSS